MKTPANGAGAGPATSASNPCEGKAFSLYLLCACV
jgi:hypothetical protein